MLYHKQKYKHNPDEGIMGDCARTSIACLLNLDRDEVPHFAQMDQTAEGFYTAVKDWLQQRGLTPFYVIYEDTPLDDVLNAVGSLNSCIQYILIGKSKSGTMHCVCCQAGKIIHDVSQGNVGVVAPDDEGCYSLMFFTSVFDKGQST